MNQLTDYLIRGAAAAQVLQSIHDTGPIEDDPDAEKRAQAVLVECCKGIVAMFSKKD